MEESLANDLELLMITNQFEPMEVEKLCKNCLNRMISPENTHYKAALAATFQKKPNILWPIRHESKMHFSTELQDMVHCSMIANKFPEPSQYWTQPDFVVKMEDGKTYQAIFDELYYRRAQEVEDFKKYMITKERMELFLNEPLNFFEWEELHRTQPDQQLSNIYPKPDGPMPLTMQRLGTLISVAYKKCKSLKKEIETNLKALQKDKTYIDGTNFLWEVVENFRNYFYIAVYLDRTLRPIKDVINEATSQTLYKGVYRPGFSIWETLVKIYISTCYKSVEGNIKQVFVESVEGLLKLFPSNDITEARLGRLMMDQDVLRLKMAGNFFVDMQVNQGNIVSVLLANPKFKLRLEDLKEDLTKSVEKILGTLNISDSGVMEKFIETALVYKQFAYNFFIPQIAFPLARQINNILLRKIEEFEGLYEGTIARSFHSKEETEQERCEQIARSKDWNIRSCYAFRGYIIDY